MIDPKQLSAGVVVRHSSGSRHRLARRKEDDSGWWMTDGSGLVDTAWQNGDWEVVPGQVIDTSKPLNLDDLRDVLARIGFRLGLIEEAITTNHQEVIHAVSNVQDTINADVATLTQTLSDFAAEWQQVSQRLAMEAPQIDTSKLDGLAQQFQAMDAAWKAQLSESSSAPGGTGSDPSASSTSGPAAAPTGTGPTDTGTATGTATGSATGSAAGTGAGATGAGTSDAAGSGTTTPDPGSPAGA